MEENQTINCTVGSCKFNDEGNRQCKLKRIVVTPVQGCNAKTPDESMCSSYENQKRQ